MRDLTLLNLSQSLYGQPWAICPDKLRELVGVFEARRTGEAAATGELATDRQRAREARAATIGAKLRQVGGMLVDQVGKVAVLPLHGTITQRPSVFNSFSGGTSAEQFAAAHLELVRDAGVKSIVWDVDSPGGSVAGVPEAFASLLSARGKKRVAAVSNTLNASAAYWLSAAADELVASPSSLTGNIGIYAVHEDASKRNEKDGVKPTFISAGKYKVEGNDTGPLGDEARAAIQQRIDDYYRLFVNDVARARNTSIESVRNGYGEGRALTAERARTARLVDRVGDLASVLKRLGA
jgi:signal peptide peptidase SppA